MKIGIISKPKAIASIRMVQTRPDGSVVPMFNENFIGRWALRVINKDNPNFIERTLFGHLEELPLEFPYGKFKPFKLIK